MPPAKNRAQRDPGASADDRDKADVVVSADQFTRTRDAVVVSLNTLVHGLANVQTSVSDVLAAYIRHTSAVLAGEPGHLDELHAHTAAAAARWAGSSTQALAALGALAPPGLDASANDASKPKKRKRKRRDPNAPKRPLTAAFLYAKHAQPVVQRELEAAMPPGSTLPAHVVRTETNDRWNTMSEVEKGVWRASYRRSLDEYRAAMKAYAERTGSTAVFFDVDTDDEMHGNKGRKNKVISNNNGNGHVNENQNGNVVDHDDDTHDDGDDNDDDDDSSLASTAPKMASPSAKPPRSTKRQKKEANGTASAQPTTYNGLIVPLLPSQRSTVPILPPDMIAAAWGGSPPKELPPDASNDPPKDEKKPSKAKRTSRAAQPESDADPGKLYDGAAPSHSSPLPDAAAATKDADKEAKKEAKKKRERKRKSDVAA